MINSRWTLGAFLIVPLLSPMFFWRDFSQSAPVPPASRLEASLAPAAKTELPESIEVPIRITIPRIKVNAAIEKVALATDGSMGVPKKPLNAGWYELGPRPGEVGSAVIAGHVNWYRGLTGAFANLRRVKPGDTIVVRDAVGAKTTFIVREIKMYDADDDATEVFISTDGKAHLNLITCIGLWDKKAKQYPQRLVVFADKK